MAGYQRMVSYLYEYNQGEKGDNVGYAKLEIREDIAKMIVSIRLRRDVTDICPVGFYYREGRQAYRIPVGEVTLSGGRVQERLLLPGAKAGESGLPVTQMNGILISLPDGLIGSAWDEQGVPANTIVLKNDRRTGTEKRGELWAAELLTEEQGQPEEAFATFEAILSKTEPSKTSQPGADPSEGNLEAYLEAGRASVDPVSTDYTQTEYTQNTCEQTDEAQGNDTDKTGMTEVPITEPRAGNNYRSETWMEKTEQAGEEAQIRRQERAEQIRQSEEQERGIQALEREQIRQQAQTSQTERILRTEQMPRTEQAPRTEQIPQTEQIRQQAQQVKGENGSELSGTERRDAESISPENSIEYFFQQSTKMCPFEDEAITNCVRIEPADLEYFPKETWILGSNSFLLHGYYTYGHLILAKMRGMGRESTIIGVPGLYQNRERFLARLFGFEYFKPISKTGAEEGDFGYWYLFLPDMEH